MSFRIAIIGGGWYGCHIATTLKALNFEIKLFEQNSRLLHEASGNNQNRLHLGFHYARDYRTRLQSRDGFQRFLERYEHLTGEIKNNLYIIPEEDSLIDFMTYKIIMLTSGIEYDEVHSIPEFLRKSRGVINTQERKILTSKARSYFMDELDGNVFLDTRIESFEEGDDAVIVNGKKYDFIVDATWGHFDNTHQHFFFEPTLLLYYRSSLKEFPALTFVDGPLCSLYPTEEDDIYTLSSVGFTPLGRVDTALDARELLLELKDDVIEKKKTEMEEQISKYYPDFKKYFTYTGPQLAIKTKPIGDNDDRSCYVEHKGRKITVMSGKIDTIFYASQQILKILEKVRI